VLIYGTEKEENFVVENALMLIERESQEFFLVTHAKNAKKSFKTERGEVEQESIVQYNAWQFLEEGKCVEKSIHFGKEVFPKDPIVYG